MRCDGACVDLDRDGRHCGACGVGCSEGEACVAGSCRCAPPLAVCSGLCVDLATDRANCGVCGRACVGAARCGGGVCGCAAPRMGCAGACVDVLTSAFHCGACGHDCPRGVGCVDGACACPGTRGDGCDGDCVDLARSADHCGACGNACGDRGACVGGACTPRPLWPPSGARIGTRRPLFRWGDGDGTVELCADRECRTVLESVPGTAARGARPTRRLDPGVYFWRVRAGATAPRGWAFRVDRRDGTAPGLLPPAPDVDGDGLKDVAVAAWQPRSLTIFLGSREGLRTEAARVFSGGPPPLRDTTLAAAGDLDDDACGDVFAVLGDLHLLAGAPAAPGLATTRYPGVAWRSPVLDVNGDGLGDWAWFDDGSLRVAYGALTRAPASQTLTVPGLSTRPSSVVALGDVSGDGYPDVAVGAPNASPPRAYVYFGGALGLDRSAPLPAPPRAEGFGASLACAGDLNGDGLADALAGLQGGAAAVYLGGADGMTLHGTVEGAEDVVLLVHAAGDVDGDGYGDLLGVPRGRGEAWLYRGGAAGPSAEPVVLRDARWAAVEAVGAPGDVDGDGFDDVVAGAPTEAAVHVFRGAAEGALTRAVTLRGAGGSEFGRTVL